MLTLSFVKYRIVKEWRNKKGYMLRSSSRYAPLIPKWCNDWEITQTWSDSNVKCIKQICFPWTEMSYFNWFNHDTWVSDIPYLIQKPRSLRFRNIWSSCTLKLLLNLSSCPYMTFQNWSCYAHDFHYSCHPMRFSVFQCVNNMIKQSLLLFRSKR